MPKRNINVIYSNNYDKKEIYEQSKEEIKRIYNNIKRSGNESLLLNELLKLDKDKNANFRILFFLSLYCSYFHKIKHFVNTDNLIFPIKECYKKHNFIILDIDDSNKKILEDIAIYFNTDANNLEPITGKILYDLNNINVQLKTKKNLKKT